MVIKIPPITLYHSQKFRKIFDLIVFALPTSQCEISTSIIDGIVYLYLNHTIGYCILSFYSMFKSEQGRCTININIRKFFVIHHGDFNL